MHKEFFGIVITGYSLSDNFSDLIDCIIRKSQEGVFVKFYVNHIEDQANYNKLADQLKDLEEQKRRAEADVIMDAYLKSGKSLDEIMTFLKP